MGISASYAHHLGAVGNISLSFLGTYLRKYTVANGIAPEYDCAGYYGTVCSGGTVSSASAMPKWRHKLRATLETPIGVGVSLNWRRVGKVAFEATKDGQWLDQLNSRVKAQNYFDLAATYSIGDKVNLRAGVNNLLDRNPPIIPTGHGSCPTASCAGNTYPGTWDYMGRFLYAGLTVNFKHRTPPPPVWEAPIAPPSASAPAPVPVQNCPDGTIANVAGVCPPPPPPAPPTPAPERGR